MERQANWHRHSGCKSCVMKLEPSTYLREPCVVIREGGREASVAVHMARHIEHRKSCRLGRRGFHLGRRQHVRHRYGERADRPHGVRDSMDVCKVSSRDLGGRVSRRDTEVRA